MPTTTTWDIEGYGDFCLALSRNQTPEQVLTAYGAEPGEARLMSATQCETEMEVTETNAILRAGKVGMWSFCIEVANPIGFSDLILRRLCDHSEAFSLSRSGHAMTIFKYARDGQLIEWFEPRNPQSIYGGSKQAFFDQIQRISPGSSASMASLKVMSGHIGAELTPEILHGPLPTVNVRNPDRALLTRPVPEFQIPARTGTRSGLGRHLGTIR